MSLASMLGIRGTLLVTGVGSMPNSLRASSALIYIPSQSVLLFSRDHSSVIVARYLTHETVQGGNEKLRNDDIRGF